MQKTIPFLGICPTGNLSLVAQGCLSQPKEWHPCASVEDARQHHAASCFGLNCVPQILMLKPSTPNGMVVEVETWEGSSCLDEAMRVGPL